jgi:hypothetical protein
MNANVRSARARFQRAVEAVQVIKDDDSWEVFRLGEPSRKFLQREEALDAARKSAALHKVGILVHESGHVAQVE